jgi:hypothetical protein
MIVIDKNQTLDPPNGFRLSAVYAEGAYIRLVFRAEKYYGSPSASDMPRYPYASSTVTIFLNDQGREVLRTQTDWTQPQPVAPESTPKLSPWFILGRGIRDAYRQFVKNIRRPE